MPPHLFSVATDTVLAKLTRAVAISSGVAVDPGGVASWNEDGVCVRRLTAASNDQGSGRAAGQASKCHDVPSATSFD